MPISDLNNEIKTTYPKTLKATYSSRFQIYPTNFYRRSITLNNTGKSVKTNYYITVQLPAEDWYHQHKINDYFSSLRVYDSDGVTPLKFYLETWRTNTAVLFIKIPSLPDSSKTIYIEYGNNSLYSQSIDVLNSHQEDFFDFSSQDLKYWYSANSWRRDFDGLNPQGVVAQNWTNKVNDQKFGMFFSSNFPTHNYPLSAVSINNLEVIRFNNSGMAIALGEDAVVDHSSFYFATVFRSTSTFPSGSYNSFFGGKAGSLEIRITPARQIDVILTNTSVLATSTLTITDNTDTILEVWLRKTGGNNFDVNFRINGVLETVSGSNSNVNSIDGFNRIASTERTQTRTFDDSYTGDIAEFIFSENKNTLAFEDVLFRDSIYKYLNAKYKIVGSDFPIVTLNSETAISQNIEDGFLAYNSTANWNIERKIENQVSGIESSANSLSISKVFDKIVVSGSENFDNSTIDKNYKLSSKISQSYNSTNSSPFTTCDFRLFEGSENLHRLDKFSITDVIDSSLYNSNDEDYISLELNIPDFTLIDKTNSLIEFGDSTFTNYYSSNLENVNLKDSLQKIFIKKKDFALIGSLTWQNATHFRTKILSSSNQTIYFGNGRLVANYTQLIKSGDSIILGDYVSLDNSSFSSLNSQYCITTSNFISENFLEIKSNNILDQFLNSKFGDLPGFIQDGKPFYSLTQNLLDSSESGVKNLLLNIFKLAFPFEFLDFDDLDFVSDFADINNYLIVESPFVARPEEVVKNRIEPIFKILGANCFFDNFTNKIKIKTGYFNYINFLNNFSNPLKIQDSEILQYINNTSDDSVIYNSINVQSYFLTQNAILDPQFVADFLPKTDLQTPFEIPPNSSAECVINLEPYFKASKYIILDYLSRSYTRYSINDEQGSLVTGASAGIKILGIKLIDNETIVFRFQNTSFNTVYFRQFNLYCAYIKYESSPADIASADDSVMSFSYQNEKSIKIHGVKEYEIGDLILNAWFWLSSGDTDIFKNFKKFWTRFIDIFSFNTELISFEVNNNPDYNLGQKVIFNNKEGVEKTGIILQINQNNSATKELTIKTFTPGFFEVDYSLNFNGVGSYIDMLSSTSNVHNLSNYTIEFWVKSFPQIDKRFYSEGSFVSNTPLFTIGTDNGNGLKVRIFARDDDGTVRLDLDSSASIFDGRCHHVSFEDSNGNYKLYIDGVLDSSGTYVKNAKSFNKYTIGAVGRSTYAAFYKGQISDFRFWTKSRTLSEIQSDYKQRLIGTETGLKSYFKLNESSVFSQFGYEARDFVNGNNGTFFGFFGKIWIDNSPFLLD